MQWVTREHPKIDRVACPWLINRFIDHAAEFLFVPGDAVLATAGRTGATPFDVPGAELSHKPGRCSFDAFIAKYRLDDPALHRVAAIVRGADTGKLEMTPQSAGLFAISHGLSRNFRDDRQMLEHGLVVYDALYTWARKWPAVPTDAPLALVPQRLLSLVRDWSERSRQRRRLGELEDWLLRDIGVSRHEAEAEAHKRFWIS
ncbi:chromate resistance protein ChrB domain-containing protein [Dongia sp.]|uniref:chromate resistance protein ChrB domain-containing protein n=1 Tax=Dongia sp. TaxID=1977262 RepID=UPI003753C71B